MSDDDKGLVVFAVETAKQVENLFGGFAVEVAGGFVGPDDGGIIGEGASDGDTLA